MTRLAEGSELTSRVRQAAWRIACNQDTISEILNERLDNTEPIRPNIREVFRRRRLAELTYPELARVHTLRQIQTQYYAAIADALLEG